MEGGISNNNTVLGNVKTIIMAITVMYLSYLIILK
jgi:hypothetical protein